MASDEVSLLRLHVLRATYLLLVVGLGATIVPIVVSHELTARGVIPSLLGAVWLLALAGLRYPLQMLPLLMFELGWKAAATNLTDVAAMGARPTALVVAIAAPPTTPVAVLEGIADGLREGLAELAPGAGVVGGDLSASTVLTIAVTAFGDLEGRAPVLRSGARVGDVLAHAGARGDAARGLALLFAEGTDATGEPDPDRAADVRARHPELVAAQLAPHPPVAAGVAASLAGATSMLDVSDGLARDARRIAEASGVGLDFDGEALGTDLRVAFAGAEDHGLLATFPADVDVPAPFEVVGRVVPAPGEVLIDGRGIDAEGWDPYSDWDGRSG